MPTISLTLPVSGTVITAGLHSTNYTTIQNAINGGLDTANWASGKIFAPSKFMQEGATTGQTLQWNGSIWAPTSASGAPTPATTLPGSPVNNQQTILTDSTSAPTYYWLLQYNSTAAKWQFIGGSPLYAEVTTAETTSSTTYAALTTAGPTVTVPNAGDYMVELGFQLNAQGGTPAHSFMSYDIGGTGAVDADAAVAWSYATQTVNPGGSAYRRRKKTAISASTALTSKYKVSANTGGFAQRYISILPIQIS